MEKLDNTQHLNQKEKGTKTGKGIKLFQQYIACQHFTHMLIRFLVISLGGRPYTH